MGLHLDHIAIAVRDLQRASQLYEQLLDVDAGSTEEVASEGVRVRFFSCGETTIELMEPLGEASPIARFLEKRGEGLHHIAFAVEDLSATLKRLEKQGIKPHGPVRQGSQGKQICFIHPRDMAGVLVELVENNNIG